MAQYHSPHFAAVQSWASPVCYSSDSLGPKQSGCNKLFLCFLLLLPAFCSGSCAVTLWVYFYADSTNCFYTLCRDCESRPCKDSWTAKFHLWLFECTADFHYWLLINSTCALMSPSGLLVWIWFCRPGWNPCFLKEGLRSLLDRIRSCYERERIDHLWACTHVFWFHSLFGRLEYLCTMRSYKFQDLGSPYLSVYHLVISQSQIWRSSFTW